MRKSGRKGEGKRARRIPVGSYPSSRIGRCVCVFGKDGLLLRVLPNQEAAVRWTAKHFGNDAPVSSLRCRTKDQVNGVFDDQMRRGLTSPREIADLLWYGGTASDWKGPKRNHPEKHDNRHMKTKQVGKYVVAFNRLFAAANGTNRRGWCVQREGDPGLRLFATEAEAVAWAEAH